MSATNKCMIKDLDSQFTKINLCDDPFFSPQSAFVFDVVPVSDYARIPLNYKKQCTGMKASY